MGLVIHRYRITPVVVQPLQGLSESQLLVEFPQQQKSRIRGDLATVKVKNNFLLKTQPKLPMTVCSHRPYLSAPRLWWFLALFLTQLVSLGGFLYLPTHE